MHAAITAFEWDTGNAEKCQKHGLSIAEIESVFLGPVMVFADPSETEVRQRAIGQTTEGRYAFLVFTILDTLIRVISARHMRKKEITVYEGQTPNTNV
jgi:uncharacterized protein